jgi:hypothetical protein
MESCGEVRAEELRRGGAARLCHGDVAMLDEFAVSMSDGAGATARSRGMSSTRSLNDYSACAARTAARREYQDVQAMTRTNAAITMACETATITPAGSR